MTRCDHCGHRIWRDPSWARYEVHGERVYERALHRACWPAWWRSERSRWWRDTVVKLVNNGADVVWGD